MAAQDYCTVDDVRLYANIASLNGPDNTRIADFIEEASRWIETNTGWTYGAETLTDVVVSPPNAYVDQSGRLHVLTGTRSVTACTAMSYRLNPKASWTPIDPDLIKTYRPLSGMPYGPQTHMITAVVSLRHARNAPDLEVRVSYAGGYDPIPADIRLACKKYAYYQYKSALAPLGRVANIEAGTVEEVPLDTPKSVYSTIRHWIARA